ncbi:MAG: aminotransferase class I/II-fold pyridoxal phosphate-dependent enzyme [Candidatus Paceibacterota bacterium]
MKNPFKPISISLSPNTQADDVKLAFSLVFRPGKWKAREIVKSRVLNGPEGFAFGDACAELELKFCQYLGVKHAYSFNSGRSALVAILDGLGLEEGSEVLLQAFTCNAAVNPIRWAGLAPIFVDCDQNYNLSAEDLKKKITLKSRVVMIQHTFGLPADIDEIKKVCDENNLILIEDCAHSLGAEYKGKKVGTFGKAAFFSFGRDKMISCVYGGMAVTSDAALAQKLKDYQNNCGYPGNGWILQQLLHPVLMNWLVLPTYSFLGRYLLVLFQWLHILSKAIHWKEKRGLKPDYFPHRMPNALAILANNQFKKLEAFNLHRQKISEFYINEFKNSAFAILPAPDDRKQVFLRFAIRHGKAARIIKRCWRKNILVGDWYRTPVDPFDTKPETVGYVRGSCPTAEEFSGKMINLPTHINIDGKSAKRIVKFIKNTNGVQRNNK